jgi:hypothetical protein
VIARATALALVAGTAGGCLRNVPRSETRSLGQTVSPPVVGSIQPLEVGTQVAGAAAIVTARWRRECRRDVIQTTETSEWESVRVVGMSDGEVWGYPAAVGLVILWPVGLAVAAASVAGFVADPPRGKTSAVTRQRVSGLRFPCALAGANLPVQLALPSGETMDAVTDATGTAVFLLPAGESGPPVGRLAPGAALPSRKVLMTPPARTARPAGTPRSTIEVMRRTAESRARRGDCDTVRIIASRVRGLDPGYFATRFQAAPAIQRCLL